MTTNIKAAALAFVLAIASPAVAAPADDTPTDAPAAVEQSAEGDSEGWHVTDDPNRVYLRGGIDTSLGIAVGYGRGFDFGKTGRDWELFGELSTAFATFGRNGAFTVGAWLPLVRVSYFRLSAEANFDIGWTRNRNYHSVRFAPGLTALVGAGHPDGRWYVDGVFGYERAIANHIEHTDFYRDVFYEDAVDGLYYGTSGSFQMGLRAGMRFGRWDVELRATHVRTERFKLTMGSPFTATLGAAVRW